MIGMKKEEEKRSGRHKTPESQARLVAPATLRADQGVPVRLAGKPAVEEEKRAGDGCERPTRQPPPLRKRPGGQPQRVEKMCARSTELMRLFSFAFAHGLSLISH